MAAQIGSLYVSLTANVQPYAAAMGRAQTATRAATAQIRREVGLTQASVNHFQRGVAGSNFRPYAMLAVSRAFESAADRAGLLRGVLLATTAVAGGFATALSSNVILRYADSFTSLQNQIRTVTDSTSGLIATQEALAEVAKRSRASLEATGTFYARTARATEFLGLSQEKLLRITETVQKSFAVGGATAAEAQGAAIQLSQGIASDRFSGEEFRSVAENAPVLLRGMAESLNVTIGKLREMAHAGELTASVVTRAILESSEKIDRSFEKTTITFDRSLTQLDNALIEYIGRTDKAYNATGVLGSAMVGLGNNIDTVGSSLGWLATGLLATFAGRAASRIGGGMLARIRDDAKQARDRVAELSSAQKELRQQTLAAGLSANSARRAAQGDQREFADTATIGRYQRALEQVQRADEKRLELNEKLRTSYSELSRVTATMSPRAVSQTESEIEAKQRLIALEQQRMQLNQRFRQLETAQAEATRAYIGSGGAIDLTGRVRTELAQIEREITKNAAAIDKAFDDVERHHAGVMKGMTEAEQVAARERIRIASTISQQQAAILETDETRARAVAEARVARLDAEKSGSEATRRAVQESSRQYRELQTNLTGVSRELRIAERAATRLGVAGRFVGRQWSSIIGLFGGGWGALLTGGLVALSTVAARAQRTAVEIANVQAEIRDLLAAAKEGDFGPEEVEEAGFNLLEDQIRESNRQIERLGKERARIVESITDSIGFTVQMGSFDPGGFVEFRREVREIEQAFLDGNLTFDGYIERLEELDAATDAVSLQSFGDDVDDLRGQLDAASQSIRLAEQSIADLQARAAQGLELTGIADLENIVARVNRAISEDTSGIADPLRDEIGVLRLRAQGLEDAADTQQIMNKAREDGLLIDEEIIRALVAEKNTLEETIAQNKRVAKGTDEVAKAAKRYAEGLEDLRLAAASAPLAELQQSVVATAQYLGIATSEIEAFIAAAIDGDLDGVTQKFQEITDLLKQQEFGRNLSESISRMPVSQLREAGEFARYLNDQLERGNISSAEFGAAYNDMVDSLDLGWIDDVSNAFGEFVASGITDFENLEDAALNFAKAILNIAVQVAVVEPLVRSLRTALSGLDGGGGIGGLLSSLGGGAAKPSYAALSAMASGSGGLFSGGGFTGFLGRNQPAGIVHGNEYVMSAQAVDRIGLDTLDALHRWGRGFADGGFTGGGIRVPSVSPTSGGLNINVINPQGVESTVTERGDGTINIEQVLTPLIEGIVGKSIGQNGKISDALESGYGLRPTPAVRQRNA